MSELSVAAWVRLAGLAVSALALSLFLSACAGIPIEKQGVDTKDDQFTASATIAGTKQFENPFGGVFKEWFIRSFVDKKTGVVSHQLYVNTHYFGEWHFYESGADDTAAILPFLQIDRHVGNCGGMCDFDETFALTLQDSVLRARAASGFAVKVSAKDGTSFILQVSPGQIKPQLAAVDDYRRTQQLLGAPPVVVQSPATAAR